MLNLGKVVGATEYAEPTRPPAPAVPARVYEWGSVYTIAATTSLEFNISYVRSTEPPWDG